MATGICRPPFPLPRSRRSSYASTLSGSSNHSRSSAGLTKQALARLPAPGRDYDNCSINPGSSVSNHSSRGHSYHSDVFSDAPSLRSAYSKASRYSQASARAPGYEMQLYRPEQAPSVTSKTSRSQSSYTSGRTASAATIDAHFDSRLMAVYLPHLLEAQGFRSRDVRQFLAANERFRPIHRHLAVMNDDSFGLFCNQVMQKHRDLDRQMMAGGAEFDDVFRMIDGEWDNWSPRGRPPVRRGSMVYSSSIRRDGYEFQATQTAAYIS